MTCLLAYSAETGGIPYGLTYGGAQLQSTAKDGAYSLGQQDGVNASFIFTATEPPLNNVLRNNNFHHTSLFGSTQSPPRGAGISFASGSGHQAYNNLFWSNYNEGARVSYASSCKFWQNTFYKNAALGLYLANNPATAKNNGFWQNGDSSLAQQLVDQSVGSTKQGNRFDDPRFVQP